MSKRFEERLTEWALWFHENKDRSCNASLPDQIKFQAKAIDGLLECLALAAKDIQNLEHRAGERSNHLWLPGKVNITGDLGRRG